MQRMTATACVGAIYELTVDIPSTSTVCSTSREVDIVIAAANKLGLGPPSEPTTIGNWPISKASNPPPPQHAYWCMQVPVTLYFPFTNPIIANPQCTVHNCQQGVHNIVHIICAHFVSSQAHIPQFASVGMQYWTVAWDEVRSQVTVQYCMLHIIISCTPGCDVTPPNVFVCSSS